MVLAIDVGNTNIALGFFKGKRLVKRSFLSTPPKNSKASSTKNRIIKDLEKAFAPLGYGKGDDTVIISSVVPRTSTILISVLKKHFGLKTLLVGKDIKVPIKNLYSKPKQVGQDRLVNAYACLEHYGKPAIIVDFGTATTFDYIDKNGAYAGGLITPGVEISLDALAARTALLPRIKLKKPNSLVGKDTIESMRSGVLYGLASLCDGVVEKIRKVNHNRAKVIATGGLAPFFAPYCRYINRIDKDLTLRGLFLVYKSQI